ncbi:iron-containing alcohol dehydrogenase [Gimesia algae]|uniref:Alcohol dehydrogenase 2 n=1 Tax=Gimesia algae TaxID=2527971 RepID=A0A517VIL3_9PLAN|nr:Alcohol dehydrogenase 2 [Gimesia algae]
MVVMDSKSTTKINTELEEGASLSAFDYAPRTRIVFGSGSLNRLGELAVAEEAKRVLLVTDKGLAAAGHEARAVASLQDSGIDITIFDDVHANPTTKDVERGLQVARQHEIDLIVGLGGGSSMDCAKGINFLLTNGGKMEDYWGVGKASKPMLPLIAVPTTAGTGSEAQSFAVIAHPETHMKMACGDKKAACRVAILDPELTLTMPRSVTHVTGIDALSHALETFVTKPRNEISQLFSRRAWTLLANSFPQVLNSPNDLQARGNMQLGAHFAGAAIENSMLGATHALANPLSAHFGLTHGIAIGIMLPHVIRFNAEVVGQQYSLLASDIGLCDPQDPAGAGLLAEHFQSLVSLAGAPTTLSECEVDPNLVDQLAEEASRQWTGNFNPRPVDQSSLRDLYECAF